jgi:GAF domain-containing protein
VADVAAEPALADLTWPARIGINAYLGVPISTSTRMYLVLEALRRLDSRSHSSA